MSDGDPTHHDLHVMLVRMEGKLDNAIENASEDRSEIKDHRVRIGSLESWRNRLVGAYIGLTLVFGMIATWIGIKQP